MLSKGTSSTHHCNCGKRSSDERGAPFANVAARAKANFPIVDNDLINSFLLAVLGAARGVPSFVANVFS